MIKTLRRTMDEAHPSEVVVEGYPETFPCERAVELYLTNESSLSSEQDFVAWLALQGGVRVSGGEPLDGGLRGSDRYGLQILQQLAMITGPCPSPNLPPLEVLTAGIFQNLRNQYGEVFPFNTSADFLGWYRGYNGTEFRLEGAYQDLTPSPNLPPGVTPRQSNRAYYEASLIRDTNALRSIRSALLRSRNVLTVYGSGHLERTAPVLTTVMTPTTPVARCRD
jgi:hypothetical protein